MMLQIRRFLAAASHGKIDRICQHPFIRALAAAVKFHVEC